MRRSHTTQILLEIGLSFSKDCGMTHINRYRGEECKTHTLWCTDAIEIQFNSAILKRSDTINSDQRAKSCHPMEIILV